MSDKDFIFLENHRIDRDAWDHAILHSPDSNVYALSSYLDVVSPGWCALVKHDYSAVFPVPLKKKVFINYISNPFFVQQLGLFGSESDANDVNYCLSYLRKNYGIINLNLPAFAAEAAIKSRFKVTEHKNYVLDMSGNIDKIRKNHSTNLKRNLQKAAEHNLSVSQSDDQASIINLFTKNKGIEIGFLKDKHYVIIDKLLKTLIEKKLATVEYVLYEGEAVAGICWVHWKNRKIFLFSALSEAGRKVFAMPYLIDDFISRNCSSDSILDFEGSDNESLARFYKGFGAELQPYISIESPKRFFLMKLKKG